MDTAQAIYQVCRDHVFLFAGFTGASAMVALLLTFGKLAEGRWLALMTSVWVVIHTAIAMLLLRHIHVPSTLLLGYTFAHIMKWLAVNLVLDLLYGLVGYLLLIKAGRLIGERYMLRGFGMAVLLQSIGLIVIDTLFLVRVYVLYRAW